MKYSFELRNIWLGVFAAVSATFAWSSSAHALATFEALAEADVTTTSLANTNVFIQASFILQSSTIEEGTGQVTDKTGSYTPYSASVSGQAGPGDGLADQDYVWVSKTFGFESFDTQEGGGGTLTIDYLLQAAASFAGAGETAESYARVTVSDLTPGGPGTVLTQSIINGMSDLEDSFSYDILLPAASVDQSSYKRIQVSLQVGGAAEVEGASPPPSIPVPGTIMLLSLGVAGIAYHRRLMTQRQ